MQTTCAVLTPRVVWCRARAPAGLAKLSQLLALSPWHFIAHGRSESSSKEQISARAFISEIRAAYRPMLVEAKSRLDNPLLRCPVSRDLVLPDKLLHSCPGGHSGDGLRGIDSR